MKAIEKTNPLLISLIKELREHAREQNAPIWRDIAGRLERSERTWAEVNVGYLAERVDAKEHVVIPGKLLGGGSIKKPVFVAAFSVTPSAAKKIAAAGGRTLSIPEMVKELPKGTGVRIIK